MKWFFSLNQISADFESYAQMAMVAVVTAQRNTGLEPNLLWDGDNQHEFARWMRSHGVIVWPVRSRFYDALQKIARQREDSYVLSCGAGAFLRLELAALSEREGFLDEQVLYTDVDVMFQRDPVPLLCDLKPRFFAVAPETDLDIHQMNTGVMLINLRAMLSVDAPLSRFVRKHLHLFTDRFRGGTWDQSALRAFFSPLTRRTMNLPASDLFVRCARRFHLRGRPLWNTLPPELNAPPYTLDAETQDRAYIIHFHGPKPTDNVGKADARPMETESFFHFCGHWHIIKSQMPHFPRSEVSSCCRSAAVKARL